MVERKWQIRGKGLGPNHQEDIAEYFEDIRSSALKPIGPGALRLLGAWGSGTLRKPDDELNEAIFDTCGLERSRTSDLSDVNRMLYP